MKNKAILLVLIVLWMLGSLLAARQVTRGNTVMTLEAGVDWAFKAAAQQGIDRPLYVGYLVQRTWEKNNKVCFHHSDDNSKNSATLYEIIYKTKLPKDDENLVAVFFKYPGTRAGRFDYSELQLANLDSPVNCTKLDDAPIFWLEKISLDDSISFLEQGLKRAKAEKMRENLVTAVGIHGPNARVFSVLKSIIDGNDGTKIRKDAVFWLSQQQSAEAAEVLLDVVNNDKDIEVRENAVFGLSQVNRPEADAAIIKLAKSADNKKIKKTAIFWLSQRAMDKTADILEEVIQNEEDRDVQEAAVFAISQLKEKGVPKLISLAKTHRSLNVRKKAIFWLGQSNDPRALETILKIIEK